VMVMNFLVLMSKILTKKLKKIMMMIGKMRKKRPLNLNILLALILTNQVVLNQDFKEVECKLKLLQMQTGI